MFVVKGWLGGVVKWKGRSVGSGTHDGGVDRGDIEEDKGMWFV